VPEMPEQSSPVSETGPRYKFGNLTQEFAAELVADLSGLGEAFDKGEVDQLSFLNFCVNHLGKINAFIEFNWT
jgi:hypothetical protein